MKYYIEITLLDEGEENLFKIWSQLFTQVHLGLVELQDVQNKSSIGVSFPEYFMGDKFGVLGSKLRLFSNEESELIKFNATQCLLRLENYIHLTKIKEVPQQLSGYSTYNRYQAKTNKEKLARRYAKRHQINYEEALKFYEKLPTQSISKPFIHLKSLSNKQIFSLWIQKTSTSNPINGKFSTYGLSRKSTIPEF